MSIVMSIHNFETSFSTKLIYTFLCDTVIVDISETVAGDRSSRSPFFFFFTKLKFCRKSSMNVLINNWYRNQVMHLGKKRYFLWIAVVPLHTIMTTFGNAHARIGVTLASRRSPGSAFIKPDQRNPWIKDQLANALLSTICTYSYQILCHVGGTSPPTWHKIW